MGAMIRQVRDALKADKPIYLASPYSHPDPTVREERYKEACMAAAGMMRAGHLVYSPIVHSHPLTHYGLPTDWGYWKRLDEAMLSRCSELLVLTLDGWLESEGVRAEVGIARRLGMPVWFVTTEDVREGRVGGRTLQDRPRMQAELAALAAEHGWEVTHAERV